MCTGVRRPRNQKKNNSKGMRTVSIAVRTAFDSIWDRIIIRVQIQIVRDPGMRMLASIRQHASTILHLYTRARSHEAANPLPVMIRVGVVASLNQVWDAILVAINRVVAHIDARQLLTD